MFFKENWNGLRKAPRRGSELKMLKLLFVYFCFRTNFNMEDVILLPCIAIMFPGFHNHFVIFYLYFPIFWWKKEGLLFFIYRIENQMGNPVYNPVSTSWNWNLGHHKRPQGPGICHQMAPCLAHPTDSQRSTPILSPGLCSSQFSYPCLKAWEICT